MPDDQTGKQAIERLVARLGRDLRTHAGIDMSDRLLHTSVTVLANRSHGSTGERWAQVHAPSCCLISILVTVAFSSLVRFNAGCLGLYRSHCCCGKQRAVPRAGCGACESGADGA